MHSVSYRMFWNERKPLYSHKGPILVLLVDFIYQGDFKTCILTTHRSFLVTVFHCLRIKIKQQYSRRSRFHSSRQDDVIFYTRTVKVNFMCFILIAHLFSFILFSWIQGRQKNKCHKVYLFTFILDTGVTVPIVA